MDGVNLLTGAASFLFLLIAIAWIVLPFALFGTKPILRDIEETNDAILEEMRSIRELLEDVTRRGPDGNAPSG